MEEARTETVRPAGAPVVPMAPMNPPTYGGGGGEGAGATIEHLREVGGDVGAQVRDRATGAVDDRTSQAGGWATATADDLREIADELRGRGRERPARIAEMAGDGIAQAGDYLSDTGPDTMVHDLRDFARRQPVAFAAGAAVVGIALARVLRATASGSR
jgi:hypothetical protein